MHAFRFASNAWTTARRMNDDASPCSFCGKDGADDMTHYTTKCHLLLHELDYALVRVGLNGVAARLRCRGISWAARWGFGPRVVDLALAVVTTEVFQALRALRSRDGGNDRIRELFVAALRRILQLKGCSAESPVRTASTRFIWHGERVA